MVATFPLNRTGRPSRYKKPKARRKESAARVKRVREALGLTQPEFAKRLTEMALAEHSPNITSVWAVKSWEMAKREPDHVRMRLIERLERGVASDGGTGE